MTHRRTLVATLLLFWVVGTHAGLEAGVHRLSWEVGSATEPTYNVYRGSLDVLLDAGLYDHEPVPGGCGVAGARGFRENPPNRSFNSDLRRTGSGTRRRSRR